MCGNVPSRAWNLLAGFGRRALYFRNGKSMRRCNFQNDNIQLDGGCVAGFALTILMTLAAFFLGNAGVFDSKPTARAASPPRGDVVVLSTGEMAQVGPRIKSANPSLAVSHSHNRGFEQRVAGTRPENRSVAR